MIGSLLFHRNLRKGFPLFLSDYDAALRLFSEAFTSFFVYIFYVQSHCIIAKIYALV